jgi:hypothetical protein
MDLIKVDKALTSEKYKFTKTSIVFNGNLSFEEWATLMQNLKLMNGAVHFWIGDALNFGDRVYGEMYTQAVEDTGFDVGTLMNDKWVASRIEKSRRHESLPFSHHQEVAELSPEEQDQMLELAEIKHLTRSDFRKAIRNFRLSMDLPELSKEQMQSDPEEFRKAQELVMMLIEVTDEISSLKWDSLTKDAKDYLLSQVRKTAGTLGNIIVKQTEVIEK